ncbi:PilN domain-containing protein [Agarivorans sp. QJM3NY_29]|uniref:PilN domain-containing protein n=1 Tax=unclassified Agarivorans TaxID=2636026 RepID=UPI003D7CFDDF
MKTRINFYTEEFHAQKERVSLRQSILLWFVLGIVLIAYGFWLQTQTQIAIDKASQQRQLVTLQSQELSTLKQALEARSLNPDLQRDSALQQQQLKLKRLLQQRLKNQTDTNKGFSATLRALASIHDNQVWLSHIYIQGDTMALSGQSATSDAVPKWLKQFQDYPELAKRQFSALTIQRDEQQQLQFSLSASAELQPDLRGAHD